jgi:hypothetical protein
LKPTVSKEATGFIQLLQIIILDLITTANSRHEKRMTYKANNVSEWFENRRLKSILESNERKMNDIIVLR